MDAEDEKKKLGKIPSFLTWAAYWKAAPHSLRYERKRRNGFAGKICFCRCCASGAYGLSKGRCAAGLGWRLGLGCHQVMEAVRGGQITEERVQGEQRDTDIYSQAPSGQQA